MEISVIAAVTRNGAIGRRGKLLFSISDDLKRFKALTTGHPVIMGRRTFESLPKGALPNRRNIVITRNRIFNAPGAEKARSIEDALAMLTDSDSPFIIGGGDIYRQIIGIADRLWLTEIDETVDDADTFFPDIDSNVWKVDEQSDSMTDPRSGVSYRFVCYSRR